MMAACGRPFSALGRAVWDETEKRAHSPPLDSAFSALGRAVWDETAYSGHNALTTRTAFSALGRAVWDETEVEELRRSRRFSFSALGRAVWDETRQRYGNHQIPAKLSVLSVEPYGMKHITSHGAILAHQRLSVLSVEPYGMKQNRRRFWPCPMSLSVLSVEPYGMKPQEAADYLKMALAFSALGRAVWDET